MALDVAADAGADGGDSAGGSAGGGASGGAWALRVRAVCVERPVRLSRYARH